MYYGYLSCLHWVKILRDFSLLHSFLRWGKKISRVNYITYFDFDKIIVRSTSTNFLAGISTKNSKNLVPSLDTVDSISIHFPSHALIIQEFFFKKIHNLPNESVALILKNANLLYVTKWCEGFLYNIVGKTVGNSTAINCTIRRTRLVVYFVESQRFRVA